MDQPGNATRPGRITRRTWLSAAIAAAAGTAVGTARPVAAAIAAPAQGPDDLAEAYQAMVAAVLKADADVRAGDDRGGGFLYRPGQLLVGKADLDRVLAWLRARKIPVTRGKGFAGVERLLVGADADVPGLVAALREPGQWKDAPVPVVQPHHVLVGFGNIMGNPDGPPAVAPPLAPPDQKLLSLGAGVTVGVCDTGIWSEAAAAHPAWLGGGYLPEADDADPLYLTGDQLAPQGGHGTFVAGVLRQAAPGVRFDPEPALAATGLGDEEMLCDAIGRLDPATTVINCSLGGYTQGDVPPAPIADTIAALPADTLVVAAAGNAGDSRPAWPAALPGVVAVAALAGTGSEPAPAGYSNFGPWVSACAVGARTSTYVKGVLVMPGAPVIGFSGYASWAGTSFAAPHVCGRIAALMSSRGLTAPQALAQLTAGAATVPGYGALIT